MTAYLPTCAACPACRDHDPHTYHHSCQGCQARRVAAERAAALSDEHVGFHLGRMAAGATCAADAEFYGRGGYLTGDVTHWMPFPADPKEKP